MTTEQDARPTSVGLIIDGQTETGSSGRTLEVRNPAFPDQVVGVTPAGSRADVQAAVDAAERAFPAWAALSYEDRAHYLQLAALRIEQNADERIDLLVRENGKVRREAAMDLARLVRRMRSTAGYASEIAEECHFPPSPAITQVTHHPMGVVALIVPWNWPLSILGAKLPQALLAGNTVVIKPSPLAPLATMQTVQLIADVLPPGVINAVTGGVEVGEELVAQPRIRKIDFTGGVESGRAVMATAASTLKRLTLELGGNDPAVVLADAKITPESLAKMAAATFMTTGQTCMAIKRLYVHQSRFAEVTEGLADVLGRTVVGDGLDPSSTMGPVISAERKKAVVELIENAKKSGAEVREFGQPLDQDAFSHGHFLLPSLITGVDHSFRVVSEEQFGPTLPIMSFQDEREAIRLANDSNYGLCSSVWTSDVEHGLEIARQLRAGTTHINQHGPAAQDDRAPFGGIKDSGIGSELGLNGIRKFMDIHTITIA